MTSQYRDPDAVLRHGIRDEAARAPQAGPVIDTVLETVRRAGTELYQAGSYDRDTGVRRLRSWLAPVLVAAVTVLAVGAAVVIVRDRQNNRGGTTAPPGTSTSPAPGPSASPTGGTSSPRPSGSSTASGSPTTGTALPPVGGPVPAGFLVADLSFVGRDYGFALGTTASCGTPPCTSLVRTTDGGAHWVGLPAPVAPTDLSDGVQHVRFASPMVGYAYGPNALWMTTDGARTWRRLSGGAYGLEIAGDGVVRLIGSPAGCLPGCRWTLERATVGSTSWAELPAATSGLPQYGAGLTRSGPVVVAAFYGHVAGGAQSAGTTLLISSDGGASWRRRGEPCTPRQSSGTAEQDTRAVTVAPDRSISVLCVPRGSGGIASVQTSTDGGTSFSARHDSLGQAYPTAVGAASARTVFAASDSLYRSTDDGAHWSRSSAAISQPSFIGFQTSETGRVIDSFGSSQQGSALPLGHSIYTTTDAGASWSVHTFR
jgi:photosystem II stability/assembly factor-like uncharacterized protein